VAERLDGPSMLAIVGDRTGPSMWRVFQPFKRLEERGYPCGWDFKSAPLLGQVAPAFDGYVLARMSWPLSERVFAASWFAMLRRAGKTTVYECDDDLFSPALSTRAVELGQAAGRSAEQLEEDRQSRLWTLRQCDGATVSTQRLATLVRTLTDRPVVVVPNAIDVPWFRGVLRQARRTVPGPAIGWAGGQRPDRDVAAMAEAWCRIAAADRRVTFVIQGYVPPVLMAAVPADRLVVLPWLPLERYPAGLVEVDVACCSVADEPFNRHKSPIKAYEAALAGSAVVATPTVYGGTIEHGVMGYLAETADEWERALSDLVARPAHRAIMARRLLRRVERDWSLAENLWRWPAAWAQIAEAAGARRRADYDRVVVA